MIPDGMPVLSAGAHKSPQDGACVMEYVSLLAGEEWTDRPSCTFPILMVTAWHINDGPTPSPSSPASSTSSIASPAAPPPRPSRTTTSRASPQPPADASDPRASRQARREGHPYKIRSLPVTKTVKPQVLEIDARALKELTGPVVPLAGKTGDLPVLNAVLIERRGTVLTATATDRYRLGVCKATVADNGPFRALVSLGDLSTILSVFRTTRTANPTLRLTVDGDALSIDGTGELVSMVEARVSFRLVNGEFPKATVDLMLSQALSAPGGGAEPSVNGAYLADFRHAPRDGAPLVITPGASPTKPVIVRCGDHFLGVIMPVRTGDSKAPALARTAWLDALGIKAVEGEAAA